MSGGGSRADPPSLDRDWIEQIRRGLGRVLLGDRLGLMLFLGSLLFFGITLRVDVFINDNYTLINTLGAVARGQLHLDRLVHPPFMGVSPGLHLEGGRVYGRNYGQLVLSLPFLWLLQLLDPVAELRVLLLGAWCLGLLSLVHLLGLEFDREFEAAATGAGLSLALFGVGVLLGTPLQPGSLHALALQLSSMTAAALLVVFVYRLVARIEGRQVGAFAGLATLLATPVGFWATIPKRHSYTAMLVVLAVYCFYRSRDTSGEVRTVRAGAGASMGSVAVEDRVLFRSLAYACAGITAWIHSVEGLLLFVALLAVDLPLSWNRDWREHAVVAAVFAASVLPFVVTNTLIAGDPFEPPRALQSYDLGSRDIVATGGEGDTIATGGEGDPSAGGSDGPTSGSERSAGGPDSGGNTGSTNAGGNSSGGSLAIHDTAVENIGRFVRYLRQNIDVFGDGPRLYHTFVRSGYVDAVVQQDGGHAARLAVLEAMPLAAVLAALPATARRGSLAGLRLDRVRENAARPTDLLVLLVGLLFVAIYLPRLPIDASHTVRYLHPLYPLLVYAVARVPTTGRVVRDRFRTILWTYVAVVAIGGQLLFATLVVLDPTLGEAVQLNALVALAAAATLGVTSVLVATIGGHERHCAVAVALAGGTTTLFLLFSAFVYFPYGEFALPFAQEIATFAGRQVRFFL